MGREVAGKMVQKVKVLAAYRNGLSSVPGTFVVKGENPLLQVALKPSHACSAVHMPTHTDIHQINKYGFERQGKLSLALKKQSRLERCLRG